MVILVKLLCGIPISHKPYVTKYFVINSINNRALNLENVAGVREASLDLYIAARDAYNQARLEDIEGVEGARAIRDEDLYFFDTDFDQ